MQIEPFVPQTVVVHLGRPDQSATDVTLNLPDYLKNVASCEVYPTWPEEALRANLLAQGSFLLNRIYTEWYRSQGYPFDITNSTQFDQAFVYGRDVFENVSRLVDELFDDYLQREGFIEPFFAAYCNGTTTTCEGLSQWGSLARAEAGENAQQILAYYYGDNLELVENAPIRPNLPSYPGEPLTLGSSGSAVRVVQVQLNRISANYPTIPKVARTDGSFGEETRAAVVAFQGAFALEQDGIVGPETWWRLSFAYVGVKKLAELGSEGVSIAEVSLQYPGELAEGDNSIGVRVMQHYLSTLSVYQETVSAPATDGVFGPLTRASLESFQRYYQLPVTGVLDRESWDTLTDIWLGVEKNIVERFGNPVSLVYPGTVLRTGSTGTAVETMQRLLNLLAGAYPGLPTLPVTGYYGSQTQEAVREFQLLFGLSPDGQVGPETWDQLVDAYEDICTGSSSAPEQHPGYVLSESSTQEAVT